MTTKKPIGTVGKANRKIVAYTDNRSRPYLVKCLGCGFELIGTSGTLDTPCKKCSYVRPWRQDLRSQVYYKYRYNASLKGLAFEINQDDFFNLMSSDCHYCGAKPSAIWKSHRKFDNEIIYNGVDRVDNCLGYIYENCVACCTFCNRMKKDFSISVFKEYVKKWSKRVDLW